MDRLEPMLVELRTIPGLVEKRPGSSIAGRPRSCTSTKTHRVCTRTFVSATPSSADASRPLPSVQLCCRPFGQCDEPAAPALYQEFVCQETFRPDAGRPSELPPPGDADSTRASRRRRPSSSPQAQPPVLAGLGRRTFFQRPKGEVLCDICHLLDPPSSRRRSPWEHDGFAPRARWFGVEACTAPPDRQLSSFAKKLCLEETRRGGQHTARPLRDP